MPSLLTRSLSHLLGALDATVFPHRCAHCSQKMGGLSFFPKVLCSGCLEQLQLLDPSERCSSCFAEKEEGSTSCAECLEAIFLGKAPSFRIISAFAYQGPARSVLQRFKYDPKPFLADALASFLVLQSLRLNLLKADLIVPTAVHWTKSLTRMSHPSFLLADSMAQILKIPSEKILKVAVRGFSHNRLSRRERKETSNSSHVFCKKPIPGASIFLIDDVATTGETLRLSAEALYAAGAWKVYGFTLCR